MSGRRQPERWPGTPGAGRRSGARAARLVLLALAVGLGLGPAGAGAASPRGGALSGLSRSLASGMRLAGSDSGAEVVDLSTGRTLFSDRARTGRLPASVQKLYTTSTALAQFGPQGRLRTTILGSGQTHGGTYRGTLYLRGGGDPTFGSVGFDHAHHGTGATLQGLVSALVTATGMRSFSGSIVADETYFDSLRGTPATGYAPSIYVEGELSALSFDRGWADPYGDVYYQHPALEAGQQLLGALRAAGISVPQATKVRAGATPPIASVLASQPSPTIATLLKLTNTPSDNFFAEMLLKGIGARFGTGGSTAAGAAVVRATVASRFALHPRFNDGSGLSTYDRTSPADIISLLRQQQHDQPFVSSLAVAGETGTLEYEMRGSYAQGRCRGKTGTLSDVSNVVGYCHARDGHTLAYAFLMNHVIPGDAHVLQDQMEIAIARYTG